MQLNYHGDFTIEYLGEYEETVYDIEVEDNHNFFGNGILVHNSCYFTMDKFVEGLGFDGDINKICDQLNEIDSQIITPKIESLSLAIKDYLNCYEQRMAWEREVISPVAIWLGKKKYVMRVYDSEGTRYLSKPKYKFTGMESVKSNTPAWARGILEECYILGLEFTEDELHDKVEKIKELFYSYHVNDIAVPSGIKGMGKYYDAEKLFKKGAPKHVKAALNYNRMIKEYDLRYEKITDGNKIKYVELKMPNPTGHSVIAFDTYLPPELGLEQYINYDLILEKSFIKPLSLFLNVIGWSEERKIDLFSF